MTTIDDLLEQCRYPEINDRYLTALKAAVKHILNEYDVLGIIAAGSIIRGQGHASSDWDIYVIHAKPQRQMLQRFFEGVPTQIFLNPPQMVRRYFASESAEGTCITAHMLTTGFVVLDRDPVVEALRTQAREVMAQGVTISDDDLNMRRYHTASLYENAMDMVEDDPTTTLLLLKQAIPDMLRIYFLRRKIFIPRDKELLFRLKADHPELHHIFQSFYQSCDFSEQLTLAGQIADATIEARGFFVSQTPLGAVESD
jgi:hypothetical protein